MQWIFVAALPLEKQKRNACEDDGGQLGGPVTLPPLHPGVQVSLLPPLQLSQWQ